MKLSSIMILLLLMSGIVTGAFVMIDAVADYTGLTVVENISQSFNGTIAVQNKIKENVDKVTNISVSTTTFFITMVPETLKLAANMITLPFSSFSDIVGGLQSTLNLPGWVQGLLIAIIGIVIIFSVISLILRYPS